MNHEEFERWWESQNALLTPHQQIEKMFARVKYF